MAAALLARSPQLTPKSGTDQWLGRLTDSGIVIDSPTAVRALQALGYGSRLRSGDNTTQSDGDEPKAHESTNEDDRFRIGFEAALYLSHDIGCLRVLASTRGRVEPLDSAELLAELCSMNDRFAERFLAFRHYSRLGYLVKAVGNYGADFGEHRRSSVAILGKSI